MHSNFTGKISQGQADQYFHYIEIIANSWRQLIYPEAEWGWSFGPIASVATATLRMQWECLQERLAEAGCLSATRSNLIVLLRYGGQT